MATATDQPTLVRAQVRHLRCSARKARVILDHVRGLSVMQAEATLQFSPRAAARDVLGLLRSATANADSVLFKPENNPSIHTVGGASTIASSDSKGL